MKKIIAAGLMAAAALVSAGTAAHADDVPYGEFMRGLVPPSRSPAVPPEWMTYN